MTRRLGSGTSRPDLDGELYVLRDNLGKADAFITAAEELIERSWSDDGDESDDGDDGLMRRRNHVEHLVESAKLAVRAATYTSAELAKRRRGA